MIAKRWHIRCVLYNWWQLVLVVQIFSWCNILHIFIISSYIRFSMRCLQCVATLSKIRNFKQKLKTSRFLCCQKIKLVNECVNCIDGISIRICFISTSVCRHLVCVARVSGFSTLKEKLHLFVAQKLEQKQKNVRKAKTVRMRRRTHGSACYAG